MLKETEEAKVKGDDIPINSPEYLLRYLQKYNPMFPKADLKPSGKAEKVIERGICPEAVTAPKNTYKNTYKIISSKMMITSRGLSSGSYRFDSGSGSAKFFGFGYGIDLI